MASLNSYHFGLEEAWLSTWLGVEQYGTPVQLVSAEIFNVDFDSVSGMLKGDDYIVDAHSRTIMAKVKVKFGFNRLNIISIITGETNTVSTTVSESMVISNTDRPYFSLVGRIDATELGGDFQIFLPKVKIMSTVSFGAQYGNYLTPTLDAIAIKEGSTYGIGKLIKHATATTPTIPPT